MGSALSKLVTNLTIVCIGALRIIIALAPTRPVYHALRTNEAPIAKLASVTTMSQLSRDNLRVHPQRKYLTKNFPSKASKSHTPKSKNRWDIVLPEFHLFTKLPPELRLLIWEAARPGPRVVKIFQVKSDKDFRIVYSKAKVPCLLHACIESRQVALKWYQLSFGHMHIVPSTVYFDMSADFAHFQCQKCRGRLHECDMQTCGLSVLSYYSRGQIKRVAYESDGGEDPMFALWLSFPAAEEVLLVETNKGLGCGAETILSDFTGNTQLFPWQEGKDLMTCFQEQLLDWQTGEGAERPLKKITSVKFGKLPAKRGGETLEKLEPTKRAKLQELRIKRRGKTLENLKPTKRLRLIPHHVHRSRRSSF